MRTAFFAELERLARTDDRIELIVGDLGFGVVESFAKAFPTRFTNAGVAEQNMTALAAGLALCGSVVFTYSIANFPTLRCLEQLRNDVGYHNLDVKVVAVGGGLAYGQLGFSHHATEDLAIMRSVPGFAVVAPGDAVEVEAITSELVHSVGPAYLRLGKAGEPVVHEALLSLPPGSSVDLERGDEVVVFVTGGMLPVAREAVELLRRSGIDAGLVSMPWIVPFDSQRVEAAAAASLLVTVEEHSRMGGLGSLVAEILASLPQHAPLLRLGLPPILDSVVGDQHFLRSHYGLTSAAIASQVRSKLALR